MASSAKTPALDQPNPAKDWTVVLPRHGKQKRNSHKVIIHEWQKQEHIESYEPPRLQLSLAILMKRMFSWIGEVEVFDPLISLAESRVLTSLALRPTMFFMPHGYAELYENLLEANWRHDLLSNMTLFGNSFEAYEQHVSECKNLRLADSRKYILAIRQFVKELPIDSRKLIVAIRQFVKECFDPFSVDLFRAFHGSSWHFFDIDPHSDLCDAKP
ncbi:hypothetical protein H5410_041387 [Solanum commersonii]|uniref:SRR1-like domain-containing protein n=1 Tax=Solanum commersonii TaxID=4109 RepID=A0A9J5XRP8_SOLCO|nr:hypothetical protein H5410_041387 [Solanum commersonii]